MNTASTGSQHKLSAHLPSLDELEVLVRVPSGLHATYEAPAIVLA